MIATPYRALERARGLAPGQLPKWAVRRSVYRTAETIYTAQPDELTAADLADLHILDGLGWRSMIKGTHHGRPLIILTKIPQS